MADPTTVAGFWGRWRASDLSALADNAQVNSWSSSNGVALTQATAAARPVMGTDASGRRFVLTDGVDDQILGGPGSLLRAKGGGTIYLVAQQLSTNTGLRYMASVSTGASPGNAARLMVGANSGNARSGGRRLDGDSFVAQQGGAQITNAPSVRTGRVEWSNRVLEIYQNGLLEGQSTTFQTAGVSADTNPFAVVIGAQPNANYVNMRVYELLLYEVAHSAAERAAVHSYVQDTYGVTVGDYVASKKTVALGLASEAGAALPVSRRKRKALGVAQGGRRLTWAPPSFNIGTWTQWAIPLAGASTGRNERTFSAGEKVEVVMPDGPALPVHARSAQDVVMIGGDIRRNPGALPQPDLNRRTIEIRGVTGTAHFEGVLFGNADGLSTLQRQGDGIYVQDCPGAILVVQNCRMPMIYGQEANDTDSGGDHGDAIQVYHTSGNADGSNGIGEIRIDGLTYRVNYQGGPNVFNGGFQKLDLRRVDAEYDNAEAIASSDQKGGAFLAMTQWVTGTDKVATDDFRLREIRGNADSRDVVLDFNADGTLNTKGTWSDGTTTGQPANGSTFTHPRINGGSSPAFTLDTAAPENVPDGVAGWGYVSPGYASDAEPAQRSDIALPVTASKLRRLGLAVAAEADAALPLAARRKGKALGLPAEASAALPAAVRKVKRLGLAVALEADSALPAAKAKRRALGVAGEQSAAPAAARSKRRQLTVAVEAAAALAASRLKRQPLGQAAEADEALPATRAQLSVIQVQLGIAMSVEQALAAARAKRRALGQAAEASAAHPVGRRKRRALSLAEEGSVAAAAARRKVRELGPALEAGGALPAARRKVRQLGVALEAGEALPAARRKSRALGQALEVGGALAAAARRIRRVLLGVAVELDEAQPAARAAKRAALGVAVEESAALPAIAARNRRYWPEEPPGRLERAAAGRVEGGAAGILLGASTGRLDGAEGGRVETAEPGHIS